MGDNEFRLAYSKAEIKDANNIVELVEAHRKQFAEGRVASVGSMTMASPETWAAIANESDAAARRELLQSSAVLTELDELERKAREAQQAADAKNRELNALWTEYNAIPDKIEKINVRLADIATALASLDTAKLETGFRELYRAALDGAIHDPFAQMQFAGLLVTAPLRKEVLTKLATELETELVELKARSKVLAKRLS
jgi:DNA repair exonuclease SbcCD ATPase subunit